MLVFSVSLTNCPLFYSRFTVFTFSESNSPNNSNLGFAQYVRERVDVGLGGVNLPRRHT